MVKAISWHDVPGRGHVALIDEQDKDARSIRVGETAEIDGHTYVVIGIEFSGSRPRGIVIRGERKQNSLTIAEFSPVRRLTKGYANQNIDGTHMVDLIDAANQNIIARCVYEPYADEIIASTRKVTEEERRAPN